MKKIILIMHRKIIVESLLEKLNISNKIELLYQHNYNNAELLINNNQPDVVLLEVAESKVFNMLYCLDLCERIRISNPDCKLLIMCSEKDQANIDLVIVAKEKQLIDDFVFYDVTTDYLVSKLLSI